MREQIPQCDRPRRLLQNERVARPFRDEHLTAKLRQILLDRILDRQFPFVGKDHDAGRRDRLGHAGDAKDRLLGHRRLRLQVRHADRLEADDPALASDDRHRTRDLALIDKCPHALANLRRLRRIWLRALAEKYKAKHRHRATNKSNSHCGPRPSVWYFLLRFRSIYFGSVSSRRTSTMSQ